MLPTTLCFIHGSVTISVYCFHVLKWGGKSHGWMPWLLPTPSQLYCAFKTGITKTKRITKGSQILLLQLPCSSYIPFFILLNALCLRALMWKRSVHYEDWGIASHLNLNETFKHLKLSRLPLVTLLCPHILPDVFDNTKSGNSLIIFKLIFCINL